jgi:hypothetical protein
VVRFEVVDGMRKRGLRRRRSISAAGERAKKPAKNFPQES